ncbi:molybdopterin-dependent oxidoreductase [Eggerthella sp. YY7918]|uniref:molybdopterin-dependent oxidoreductase n=1 Tax=Eggerthella sp. (strain YY7918) TaxID=502558 RepID=UPI0002171458|nr:molybdopterin-dependent oxidoreductase [Eggerthella sp. YY7918]BAK44868.1 anaerobic dehydrogenase [Eggerthella sp. YY7918]
MQIIAQDCSLVEMLLKEMKGGMTPKMIVLDRTSVVESLDREEEAGMFVDKNVSRRSFVKGISATAAGAVIAATGFTAAGCSPQENQGITTSIAVQQEDYDALGEWIPTSCNMCFSSCSILAHVIDGVVVELKGNPDSPIGAGRICGKGAAGLMQLYDPNRITKPLKRTNPNKGLDEDPGWEEVTWDEAYDEVARMIQEAGPTKISGYGGVANHASESYFAASISAFGGQFFMPDICGAGVHNVSHIYASDGNAQPDYKYCKYLLQWGSNAGIATRHGYNISCNVFAEARANGAKLVNIDPHMSSSAEKADMWVPILPGTDAALALSLASVLVHELDIVDTEFLTKRTNGPALVDDSTGRILRHPESNKALFMDVDHVAKPYDEATNPQLEGTFTVEEKTYHTAYTLYKEHLKTYTPEYVEEVTTVPATTIRMLAKEFGEAARIGETIEIDGHTLPYRPVCADTFSGISRHKHSMLSHWAVVALNLIVGSVNSVGGFIGYAAACNGFNDAGQSAYRPGIWEEDGFMESNGCHFAFPQSFYQHIREGIAWDGSRRLDGITPLSEDGHFNYYTQVNPEKYGVEAAELLLVFAANPLKNWGNHDDQIAFLNSYKHIVGIDLYLSDSSYFYDLVLPEASYLERYDMFPHAYNNLLTPGTVEQMPWVMALRQPVVPARDDAPGAVQILANICDRCGVNEMHKMIIGGQWSLADGLPDPDQMLTPEVALDVVAKAWTGGHDLSWFKEHGVYTYNNRSVEEMYVWADEAPGRVPLYWDFMYEAKEKIQAITDERGFEWEFDDYQPLPDWKPCVDFEVTDSDFDLLPVYYTDAINADSWSVNNPWINELNELSDINYFIEMNIQTAADKGLQSGDDIVLSNQDGATVEGKLVVSECVHPQVIASLVGMLGHTSKYLSIGQGRGYAIDHLIPGNDVHRLDYVCTAFDQCVRCKIEKR